MARRGARRLTARLLRLLALVLAWLVVAVPVWVLLFMNSQAQIVIASHDAVMTPNLRGEVRLDLGPYLPDVRSSTSGLVGVDLELGKTNADSAAKLAVRYATIAARPEAEERRIRDEFVGLARTQALRAGLFGLGPIGLWFLLGSTRRTQLASRPVRAVGVGSLALAIGVVALLQPWRSTPEQVQRDDWVGVSDAFPEVTVPADLRKWQLRNGMLTQRTRRLVSSLFDTYETSKVFYRDLAQSAAEVADQLHVRGQGETVAVLVSDRHDNVGMDEVVRATADEAGATVILDAGDDTSTGQEWEAFSLDSLDNAFEGYDAQLAVAGNHDNGKFVNRYLEKLGWTHLEGDPKEPFAEVRITGVDDPRSSGLGSWRDQKGLSFAEVTAQIAEDVCELDEEGERIATLLVHDANLGTTALARGCTDLVVGGHLHVQKGPTRVVGENGKAGYSYTTGTTGGAAYAVAIGSKLRREAQFTMVTYRDGRPVGIQPVNVKTTGVMVVADYVPLELDPPE